MAKTCKPGYYWCYTDKKCKKIPVGWHVGRGGMLNKDNENGDEEVKNNGNGETNGNGSTENGGGVSEGWSKKYKDSIDCDNPKGFSQRAHCQGKKKKVTEDLRKWFGTGGEGGVGGGGWDEYNTKGERTGKCARGENDDGKGPKPKCLSKEKAAKMSKSEIASAVKRKRREDPVADRPGKGGKPKMVSNKINEAKKEKDHERSMIRSQLATIRKAANVLDKNMKGEGNVEAWVQSKITKAADYIDTAADYISSGEHDIEEAKNDPCWKGYKQVGMKKKGGKEVPNCVPESVMPAAIDPKEHRKQQRAAKIRTLAQKGATEGERAAAEKKTKGPKMFGEDLKLVDKILLEIEAEVLNEKNVPTNPSLWSKMKSRAKAKFDVYPSAYANGWAAKEYKKAGGGWKSVSEQCEDEGNEVCQYCGCDPCECEGVSIEEAVRIPATTGNLMHVMVSWKAKLYSMKVFFPQAKRPTRTEIEEKMQGVYPGCKVRYADVIPYKPGEQFLQVNEGAAWTKKEGKSEAGGLNEKGRKSYERENPGSDLKAPSKKVGNKRRASFCARMKGMKKKLTSAKTANDPDSRINKSLRAWNC